MDTYKIIRFYKGNEYPAEVIKKGLTIEEAKEHCKDDDTSSATCYTLEAIERTRKYGDWFDGYESE